MTLVTASRAPHGENFDLRRRRRRHRGNAGPLHCAPAGTRGTACAASPGRTVNGRTSSTPSAAPDRLGPRTLSEVRRLRASDWADWTGKGGSVEERPNPLVRRRAASGRDLVRERFHAQGLGVTAICTLQEKALALGFEEDAVLLLPNGHRHGALLPAAAAPTPCAAHLCRRSTSTSAIWAPSFARMPN